MKPLQIIFALLAVTFTAILNAPAQSAGSAQAGAQTKTAISANHVIGEVTAIDKTAGTITVKADSGDVVNVALEEKTVYLRVPPGETTLAKATRMQLADLNVGDRVYVLGKVADDRKSVPARSVIVMTRADLTRKQEHDRAEWRRRGISGVITALNPETKEITLQTRSREGNNPVVITAGDPKLVFRRYAPDSVRFSDAKPSSFAELQVGDQLRALGEKSADGARFTPEEIVSGAFQTVGGTITAVDAERGEVRIKDIKTQKPLTVLVNKDSTLREFPPQFAAMIAQRGMNGPGGGGSGATARQGSGDQATPNFPRRRPGGEGGPDSGGAPRPRFGGGNMDMQDFIDRMPQLALADLKPGNFILVSSTKGADPSRLTAITLVGGLDTLLPVLQARMQGGRRGGGGGGGFGFGGDLSGGLPDIGMGLP